MKYIGLFDEKEDIVTKEKLETKQDKITGAATTITDDNLTASHALVSDANGKVAVSAVTSTELGYLDGVVSNVQTQLDSKQPTITVNGIIKGDGAGNLSAQDTVAAELVDLPTVPTKVSELTNDANYITAAQAPVQSVNNKTGAVSLTASDVGALPADTVIPTVNNATLTIKRNSIDVGSFTANAANDVNIDINVPTDKSDIGLSNVDNVKQYSASNPPPYPVTSVNDQTGAVTIRELPSVTTSDNGKFLRVVNSAWVVEGLEDWDSAMLLKNVTVALPATTFWYSACYGNGKFVAVDYDSTIAAYSTDGINWTQATLPTRESWTSVCYGDGKFVAVAGYTNIAAYSTDGINWIQSTLPTNAYWKSVTYGNGKFVAVVNNSNIAAYSTDGINWTQSTLPDDGYWQSVCYGNGKFVAVTSDSVAGYFAAYSSNGINWTQSALPTSTYWSSVVYGNGKFVAVASGNIAAYSADGINWTQSTLPDDVIWVSVCYGNGKFVAVASGTNIAAYSTDGVNWTQITLPGPRDWSSVCYGNDKFVAVAQNSKTFTYSTDGITWSSTTKALQYPDGTDIHEQVKDALQIEIPDPSTTTPSTPTEAGSVGTSTTYARGDHSHPNEVFWCTVTGNDTSGYTCDKTQTEILAAYNAGKVCVAKYGTYMYYLQFAGSETLNFYNNNANGFDLLQFNIDKGINIYEYTFESLFAPQATKITLTVAGWNSATKTQSVTVFGVSADATKQEIRVMPVDAALDSLYIGTGVQCIAQAANSLTFGCETVPTADIEVYVVMQGVSYSA